MRYLLPVMMLISCAAHARDTRTASWFADHPTEMRQQLALCKDDPGEAWHSANCSNAISGDQIAHARQFAHELGIKAPR